MNFDFEISGVDYVIINCFRVLEGSVDSLAGKEREAMVYQEEKENQDCQGLRGCQEQLVGLYLVSKERRYTIKILKILTPEKK